MSNLLIDNPFAPTIWGNIAEKKYSPLAEKTAPGLQASAAGTYNITSTAINSSATSYKASGSGSYVIGTTKRNGRR